jgi:hypothetical protein
MLDAAIRGRQAATPAEAVQEQEMVSTEPVQMTNGQAKAPGTVAVQTANNSSTETPVVTTNTPTPTPVKTATPVVNTTTDADGEGGTPGATKTIPVTPTPAPTETKTETKVPTWEEIVNELSKADEESEETKAKMKKKQRIATAIAALGDLATHAINVWGASNGYNAPIKGAPLTEGVAAKHKESLDAHAAKIKEYKDRIVENYKQRQEDASRQLSDAYKRANMEWKWEDTRRKAETAKIQNELRALEIEHKKMKLAFEKETDPLKKAKFKAEIDRIYASIKDAQDRLALAEERLQFDRERQDDLNTYRDKYYGARNTQVFVVGDGDETLEVDKSLWEANWAQVFDVLAKDPEYAKEAKKKKTSWDKKDFVRQHWYKNPEAAKKMEQMAAGSEEEDWEQYAQ